MKEIVRYPNCFVCGEKNQSGLRARFYWDGHEARTTVVTTDAFEGYRGILHGGVISSLLDEVMIKAVLAQEHFVVTAEMSVRFLQPARVGETLNFVGRIIRNRGRVFFTYGEAMRENGAVIATASGKYIDAARLHEELRRSLDD